jgi:hypothetical protein
MHIVLLLSDNVTLNLCPRRRMQPDDMILVGVDDHLVEPINLFEGKMPSRFADDAPGQRRREQRTVGALRAEGGDHDMTVRSFDHGRFERTAGASLGSVSAKLNV